MRILYITDYNCPDIRRSYEIRQVVNANIRNKYIDKIVVFLENMEPPPHLKNERVQIVPITKRPVYEDFYNHSQAHFPNDIIIVSNSDIMFDETIKRVDDLIYNSKTLHALTRFDVVVSEIFPPDITHRVMPYQSKFDQNWSFDTYIFKHPLDMLPDTLNIEIGIPGCDSYLIKRLVHDNLFIVQNPCFDIRTWHYDFRQKFNLEKYTTKKHYHSIENPDYPSYQVFLKHSRQKYDGGHGLTTTFINDKLDITNKVQIIHKIKVVSYCIYGDNPSYFEGAIKNAERCLDIYPEWQCWFHVHESVPQEVIDKLSKFPNVFIILMKDLLIPMFWRFLPLDFQNVEAVISRDTDSLPSERERKCVDEWLGSGKNVHIIRDHPHHGSRIMGGLCGFKPLPYISSWKKIHEKYAHLHGKWGLDQEILLREIYPLASKYCDLAVHAGFNRYESFAKDVPAYNEMFNFMGEYMYENEQNRKEHYLNIPKNISSKNISSPLKVEKIIVNSLTPPHEMFFKLGIPVSFYRVPEIPEIPNDYVEKCLNIFGGVFETCEGGVMILNSQLLPVRKSFFINIPERFDNDRFVSYQNNDYYNVATPQIWKRIWNESFNPIEKIFEMWRSRHNPLEVLKYKLEKFNEETGCLITLDKDYTNYITFTGVERDCVDLPLNRS